jgi:hypothetical protein
MALSIDKLSDSTGPVQVVKKVQDQAERDGRAAVALIQAAEVAPPEPDDSGVGKRIISLRI